MPIRLSHPLARPWWETGLLATVLIDACCLTGRHKGTALRWAHLAFAAAGIFHVFIGRVSSMRSLHQAHDCVRSGQLGMHVLLNKSMTDRRQFDQRA
jgi:hypothetical protein